MIFMLLLQKVSNKIMGKGSYSTREMNRLIKVLKRKRSLKKAAPKSFTRPEASAVHISTTVINENE